VTGWAANWNDAYIRCVAVACYENRVVSEAKADLFREDVRANGIGNGYCGFQLPIPSYIFFRGGKLRIFDKLSGMELDGSPIEIPPSYASKRSDKAPLLFIDISDMIFYLEHHDHLSGIQRVVSNILEATIAGRFSPAYRIRTVYYRDAESVFYEMPLAFVISLIGDIRKAPAVRMFKRQSDGRLHIESQAEMTRLDVAQPDAEGAVFLMLGAGWIFQNYFFALRVLKRQGIRFFPLFHDLIPVVAPAMFDRGTVEVFKIFLRKAIRNADFALTVSQHTRNDLLAFCKSCHIAPPPTDVAKNGQSLGPVGRSLLPPPIDGDYVLFVSTIEGRKNHKLAVRLWERLMAEHGKAVPKLVFVGRLGWRVEGLVEELHEKDFLDQHVVILSDVSDETLASLYQHCLFTLYPSLYEGWGLPVGESLAFGKVCLASNASSIPEAGGDFAIYFDPASLEDVAAKAARLIFDPAWRVEMEAKIAAEFRPITWGEVANRIVEAVNTCAKLPRTFAPPVLDVGEYNFSRIPFLQSDIVGDAVAQHLREFSEPKLTYHRLTLDHYILAEECLSDGVWHNPEEWGRWGHWDGNTIAFRLPDPQKAYCAAIKLRVPESFLPCTLQLSSVGRMIDLRIVKKVTALLRLDLEMCRVGEQVRVQFNLKDAASPHVEGDPRRLGVGLERMAIIERDSIPQRMEILQRAKFA
jgi:glycosyltransferase involved in cell wall biosynthesis